jgi:hypothetical protein
MVNLLIENYSQTLFVRIFLSIEILAPFLWISISYLLLVSTSLLLFSSIKHCPLLARYKYLYDITYYLRSITSSLLTIFFRDGLNFLLEGLLGACRRIPNLLQISVDFEIERIGPNFRELLLNSA